MSVKYKAMPKGQPGVVGGGDIMYYASIVRGDKIGLRKILDEITELGVAHPGAVLGVLELFLSRVDYHLLDGRAVELGQLGTFYPAISSKPVSSAEEVRRDSISRFRVNFRPSSLLQDRLTRVKFEKIANDSAEPAIDA